MKRVLPALLLVLLLAQSALAQWPTTRSDTLRLRYNLETAKNITILTGGALTVAGAQTFTGNTTCSGNLSVTGNTTHTGTLLQTGTATFTVAPLLTSATLRANGDTLTIQDLGDANFVQSEGTQTINGAKTFSTPPTITGGLTAANIQSGSAKRQVMRVSLSPNTGAAADSTVYKALVFPGRAGTVKAITFGCQVAPTVGTDTIKVLKATSAGNTMLNAATFDANTLVANTGAPATLTATGADLGLTATQGIYCEYSAGAQTVDAVDVSVTLEYEPTDF